MKKIIILFVAMLLIVGTVTSLPSIALADDYSGRFQSVTLNDRNAKEKGASGYERIGLAKNPNLPSGIIEVKIIRVFNLLPNHPYKLWHLIQAHGEFNPDLTISPNCFRSEFITKANGTASIPSISFPGPGAALSPGVYRVDTFVTPVDPSEVLDSEEANTIRKAYLNPEKPCLKGYDLLLSSEPFSTGTELIVLD